MSMAARAAFALLIVAAFARAEDEEPEPPTVDLALTLLQHDLPSFRECVVFIFPGWNTIQLLDGAMMQDCIREWSTDGGTVECIDGVCGGSGWRLYVNETRKAGVFWQHWFYGNESVEFVWNDRGELPVAWPSI